MNPAAEVNGWMRLQCFGHRLHLAIGEYSLVMIVCSTICLLWNCVSYVIDNICNNNNNNNG